MSWRPMRLSDVGDDPGGREWEGVVRRPAIEFFPHELLDRRDPAAVRVQVALRGDLIEGLADRTLEPDGEGVVRVHLGHRPVHVHDLLVAGRVPPRGRVLDQVVSHRDDDVGPVEPEVRVVLHHEPDRSERVRVVVREHALAEEGRGDGHLKALAESQQRRHGLVARHPRAREHDRMLRVREDVGRPVHLVDRGRRIARDVHRQRLPLGGALRHILGEDHERRARALGLRLLERLPDQLRRAPGERHQVTPFRHRSEQGHQVHHLMGLLVQPVEPGLRRERDQGVRVELGVGNAQQEVDRTGSEGRKAHAGLAGQMRRTCPP